MPKQTPTTQQHNKTDNKQVSITKTYTQLYYVEHVKQ